MAAVAVEGITLLAWSPDRALLMPRIFSDGGKVVTTIPIGDHVDAGDFEAATKLVFFSNGDGTVNIFHEDAERFDAIVEVIHKHTTVIVLHGSHQSGEHHGRIGRPVAVVPAMQFALRAVDRDVEPGDAARPEQNLLSAALVYRAITDQPYLSA